MSDRPIIFSAPMIRALLDGRKTQTRRVLKRPTWAQEKGWPERIMDEAGLDGRLSWFARDTGCLSLLPIPQPGDRLWVKEAWRACRQMDDIKPSLLSQHEPRRMEADGALIEPACMMIAPGRYRNARFMPRWASRMTLGVTEVRVQRLQEISEADARAEGCWHKFERTDEADDWYSFSDDLPWRADYPKAAFRDLWNSLHGPDAWDANPWVAAISFDVHRCNIDHMPGRDG